MPKHDWVDYLAALGPTIATVFAGVATVHVYLRGEKFQKRLVRPILSIGQKIQPGVAAWNWHIQIVNAGQGPANIESFTVVVKDQIIAQERDETTTQYWRRILTALGVGTVHEVKGQTVVTPLGIAPGQSHLLLDAKLGGQSVGGIQDIVRGLEIRAKYTSLLDDEVQTIRSRFGMDDRPKKK